MASCKSPHCVLLVYLFLCFACQCFAIGVDADNSILLVDASKASGQPIPDTLFGIFFEVYVHSLAIWCFLMLELTFISSGIYDVLEITCSFSNLLDCDQYAFWLIYLKFILNAAYQFRLVFMHSYIHIGKSRVQFGIRQQSQGIVFCCYLIIYSMFTFIYLFYYSYVFSIYFYVWKCLECFLICLNSIGHVWLQYKVDSLWRHI